MVDIRAGGARETLLMTFDSFSFLRLPPLTRLLPDSSVSRSRCVPDGPLSPLPIASSDKLSFFWASVISSISSVLTQSSFRWSAHSLPHFLKLLSLDIPLKTQDV